MSMPNEAQDTPAPPVILVVEDDPAVLAGLVDLLALALNPPPAAILQARNGHEALARLHEQTPDLIISDVEMPAVDGYTLLATVRERPEWVHIPFVLLTARGGAREIARGRLTGAESFIVKPFDSRELVERIATQLAKSRREQAARQQRIERLKRDILRMLQHEFRTPLTYVTAYLEFLWIGYNEAQNLQELTEHLNGVRSGSERLTRLVSDLVEALELRTGEREAAIAAQRRPVDDLAAIARAAAAARADDAAAHAISLLVDMPAALPVIYGDPAALREIFDRLLDNAIKFTRARGGPGHIELRARVADDQIIFEIEDDGIGFPPHVRETIFDLFYQHDRSYWEQQGSGVGLTLARALTRLHNGQLVGEGVPNAGARFTLYLPVAAGDATAPPSGARVRPRINLLIVEDDLMLQEGLRDLLEYSNSAYRYDVETAANGAQALKKLESFIPQLILCDIAMPQMNGYAFLAAVRQNPDWLDIPFIFLTAYGDPRDVHRGHVLGGDEYVTKPYDAQLLLQIIETRLNRYFEQTRSAARDFDMIKQQVLASIGSSIIDSLSAISLHSSEIRTLIDSSAISASQSLGDLKRSLQGIQASSGRLARLVQNATALIELRTGATAETFHQRRRPLLNVAETIGMLADASLAAGNPGAADGPTLRLALADDLPPLASEPRTFEMMIQHAIQYLLLQSVRAATTTLTITARVTGTQLEIALHSSQLRADGADEVRVSTFLASGELLTQADEGATDLAIVRECVLLHGGQVQFARAGLRGRLTLQLPIAA